eukprot:TRINITY_DN28173_c0_g1_i1.p1 TRINITY_DN28173_c0_g1~~TRINITY_DN28173_c0_g1_i1.p1  ORF type:complete len:190 (+),score=9.46 TRINITY_DN28173_c0_g1_i1:142-711(+)
MGSMSTLSLSPHTASPTMNATRGVVSTVIKAIPARATRGIRQQVLRPNQPPSACHYPLDEQTTSGHYGAYRLDNVVGAVNTSEPDDSQLVGVASVYHEAPEGTEDVPGRSAWRIRGMATLPTHQGQGIGSDLIQACVRHAMSHGGNVIWCNARTTAIPFYAKHGFVTEGDEFEIEGIGPHYVLVRPLDN